MPDLSVIIPWCNRNEISQTLMANQKIFRKYQLEIIVVNYGGNSEQIEPIVKNLECIINVVNVKAQQFNKCKALNIGVFKARSSNLFFLDADIIIQDDFITDAIKILNEQNFITVEAVEESKGKKTKKSSQLNLLELAYYMELHIANKEKILIETNCINFKNKTRSAPGLLFVRKDDFKNVNGMNSHLQYWGWEDLDIIVRLQLNNKLERHQLGKVLHLSHGDNSRHLGSKSRAENESYNFSTCLSNYHRNEFNGSYEEDIKEFLNGLGE